MKKYFFAILVTFFGFTGMAHAEKVAIATDQPGQWQMELEQICSVKGSIQMNGAIYKISRDMKGGIVVGRFVQDFKCPLKVTFRPADIGGDGKSGADADFTPDTSPTTDTPPQGGDGAGTPTAGADTGGGFQAEAPTRAEPGEEATAGGFEKPEQGGDVDGFQADTSPTTDAPAQPDN